MPFSAPVAHRRPALHPTGTVRNAQATAEAKIDDLDFKATQVESLRATVKIIQANANAAENELVGCWLRTHAHSHAAWCTARFHTFGAMAPGQGCADGDAHSRHLCMSHDGGTFVSLCTL